jgi:hypothetical protein
MGQYRKACLGFIFGPQGEWNWPCFDFAVVGVVMQTWEGVDYMDSYRKLEPLVPLARRFAEGIDRKLLGIWAAWENYTVESRNARLGTLIDLARSTKVTWLLEAQTDGWETIWGRGVYNSNWFPHKPLNYKMTKRRAMEPKDNPRRIRAMWKKAMTAPGQVPLPGSYPSIGTA